jgi:hypothetical protein
MNYTDDRDLPEVTEEEFEEARQTVRPYTAVILKPGPAFETPGPDRTSGVTATIWAHGKRNYALHLSGLLPIVRPIGDGGDVAGLCIFDASPEDVERIMTDDPGVRQNVLSYDIHPTWSFPGSTLPV